MLSLGKNNKPAPPVKSKQVELFNDLNDMWQYNWRRLNETNDLKWLIKNEKDREKFVPYHILDAKFLEVLDHWFEITKDKSNRKELYTLMRKSIIARDKVINGDRFQINWVRRYEQMIDDLTKDVTGYDPVRERMALSLSAKMMIDEKTITVIEYEKLKDIIIENNSPKPVDHGENV